MRNSILVTAAIAVVAGGIALALSQSEQVKALVHNQTTTNIENPIADATSSLPPAATTTADATTTQTTTDTTTAAATTTPATTETAANTATPTNMTPVDLDKQTPAAGTEKTETPVVTPQTQVGTFKVDVKAAMAERSIGSKTAKVTVQDYSSLTCPHCAFFHNTIFPEIKKNYIDTGKVRWVFHSFPLNEPALKADMIARCAPKEQFVNLIDLMFKDQAKWAFDDNALANLSMLVRVAGINDDMFVSCVNNAELQAAIVKSAEEASKKYDVQATPTFVLNDGEKKFAGAGSYTGFAYDLDQALAEDPKARASRENKGDFMPPADKAAIDAPAPEAKESTSPKLDPNATTK